MCPFATLSILVPLGGFVTLISAVFIVAWVLDDQEQARARYINRRNTTPIELRIKPHVNQHNDTNPRTMPYKNIDDEIVSLKLNFEEERKKTKRLQDTVYQLIRGLYNQHTQPLTIYNYVHHLFRDEPNNPIDINLLMREPRYPYIPQCEENSVRIETLEVFNASKTQLINELEARLVVLEKKFN